MKEYIAAILFLGALSIFCLTAHGQTADILGAPPFGPTHVGGFNPLDRHPLRPPYVDREPQVITEGRLALSRADRVAFATLLDEKNSGLIRLIPLEIYQATYKSERNPARRRQFILAGGPFFSFAGRTHASLFGFDIAFRQDKISVGMGGLNYGMMTKLSNTPLGAITLRDERVKSLDVFVPPVTQALAQEAYTKITSRDGLNFDGSIYRHELPAESNATYLVRSVVDRQSDVLVAFRLVRKDSDGSVVIAWKLLKQYATPKLKRTSTRFQ